jgi:hypothetical protein
MLVSANVVLEAWVHNDTTTTSQVKWSVTCGSSQCGSFTQTTTLNMATTEYTAPSLVPSGNTVTVTATSVTDHTKSVSATITITTPAPTAVVFDVTPPSSMPGNSWVYLYAGAINSAAIQIQWTVTCGSADCGSFNPTVTTGGGATAYTAPSTIPPGNTVTVTASAVGYPSVFVSATITITTPVPALANGTYVFQITGYTDSEVSFTTGVFVANDGAISGGEQDSAYYYTEQDAYGDDLYYPAYSFTPISGGSYSTTPDGIITITFNGGETLSGIMASGSQGFVAQLYGSLGNGTLQLQTSTAAPSGGYAISMYGANTVSNSEIVYPAWTGGILNIDSLGRISGTGSVLDVIENEGTVNGEFSLGTSSVSTPDQHGRVTIQLNPAASSSLPSLYVTGYVIDASHILLTETSGDNFQGVMGGMALGQGTNTGLFNSASLAGTSYVFGAAGQDNNKGVSQLRVAGVFTANTNGKLTGTLNWNDLTEANPQTPLALTGTWTVNPTGQAILSMTDGSTFNYSMYFYLTGNGNALLLSNDANDSFAGQSFQQQAAPFTSASLSGSYGINANQFFTDMVTGSLTAAPGGSGTLSFTGFANASYGYGDRTASGSFTANSNGVFTGTFTGLDTEPSFNTLPFDYTLYFVDSTRGVMIITDQTQLTFGVLQQQQ